MDAKAMQGMLFYSSDRRTEKKLTSPKIVFQEYIYMSAVD